MTKQSAVHLETVLIRTELIEETYLLVVAIVDWNFLLVQAHAQHIVYDSPQYQCSMGLGLRAVMFIGNLFIVFFPLENEPPTPFLFWL